MSISIRKTYLTPKAFLSETLYFELPKILVICFKETLASLLLDSTKTHPPKNICNHPKPTITTQSHPQSARIYLELAVTGLKPSISM